MACIEAFFIYNAKGDPVIYRLYRDNLINAFTQYFTKVKEKYIRNNYVLIYEILDDACDNGVPQITDASVLKEFIYQEPQAKFLADKAAQKKKKKQMELNTGVTHQVTGAVAHRSPQAVYRKNEVYLDVVESIDCLMSPEGTTLNAEVNGRLLLKAFLSGMPQCLLGIDKARLNFDADNCTFASIVSQREWESNSCVTFVPPDNGNTTEFEVMRYRVTDGIVVPFKIIPSIVERGRTRCSVDVTVRALFEPGLIANSVVISIPVPPMTAKVGISKSKGEAKYDGAASVLRWSINKFRGQKEHRLSADVSLVSSTREQRAWARPPVSMQFNIPMYSASPMRVLYMKVQERSNYHVEKWVRKAVIKAHRLVRCRLAGS